jgi:Ca2+-transporting ATPase
MWASEPIPFDPMEIALHREYEKITTADERPQYQMIHEYPLSGKPPMMTHIFENNQGNRIIATKGAPEALMNISDLTVTEKQEIQEVIKIITTDGYRVLAVGQANYTSNNFPATQQEFKFTFKGIVAFYDPPKKNIQSVLADFYAAGISVKIITGDNSATTSAIAKQIDFK